MDAEIIVWEEKYNLGIALVDTQHKELVNLISQLYRACCSGEDVEAAFKAALSRMVEYVHFHFGVEQQIMERIDYPGLKGHIKEHTTLIKNILEAAKDYSEGKRFVPHHLVRLLKDWILSHIAVSDRQYASFIAEHGKNIWH
ncbi:MAG: bacteriohemerythrin [Treponema sp.]|nr:bacteriohemerythrin [Treponema sp.]